jgi:signal transduction histidine kinase
MSGNSMRLSSFIEGNIERILAEWEAFARSLGPVADGLSKIALRDHAQLILLAVAKDIESVQTEAERDSKSKGQQTSEFASETFSSIHGALRQLDGFDLVQVAAEYRALRATVLRLWKSNVDPATGGVLEQVMRFNESIDQSLAEAIRAHSERVDNSRDTFLAVLGHDLRGPLSSISACLEVAGREEATPAQIAKATRIGKRGIAVTKELIDELLEYTRTRLGKGIEVDLKPVDFSEWCRETFDEITAANPNRTMTADIAPNIHLSVDAPRIRQVLCNLLQNALQHGDPAFSVELMVRQHRNQVELAVRNQGVPIPPKALHVIFNPLVQIPVEKDGVKQPSSSLGLGLFIAREIATGHGGTIAVKSSAQKGTVFMVKLPLEPPIVPRK